MLKHITINLQSYRVYIEAIGAERGKDGTTEPMQPIWPEFQQLSRHEVFIEAILLGSLRLIIKHQRPRLNAFPGRIILMRRIHKRCVRDPPRAPIVERIVALDEDRFIGPLRVLEVPLVARIRLDRVRLAFAVWVD